MGDFDGFQALLLSPAVSHIDAAILECSLDNYLNRHENLIKNSAVIYADDFLEVTAKSHDKAGLKSFMNSRFIQALESNPTYHLTPPHCGDNKTDYPTHTIKPTGDSVITYTANHVYLKINRLAHLTASRYSLILDRLVESSVFAYNLRIQAGSKRNKREAMRQVLNRNFKIHRYETGFTFNPVISALLAPVFERNAVESVGQCHYLKNNPNRLKVLYTSKAYDITATQDSKRGTFATGDKFKLECTLWPTFFKKRCISIKRLSTPNNIFGLLNADNLKFFTRFVLDKLTKIERLEFYRLTDTHNNNEVITMLSNIRTLQTNVDIDRLSLENQFAQINFAIHKVLLHDRQINEIKNDNAEMKAQINSLLSAVESLKNNPDITGKLDDIRKKPSLKLVISGQS